MMIGKMPLYPALRPGVEGSACVTMPLFDEDCPRELPPCGDVRRVRLENPCCPGEWVEVLLGVDRCGNLAVCVRRDCDCCPGPRRGHPPACRRPRQGHCGRLYGDWDCR